MKRGSLKARNQARHARERARERYGIELGPHTREVILDAIRSGASTVVARTSRRLVVHEVVVDGDLMRVVYDRRTKELATVLPRPQA